MSVRLLLAMCFLSLRLAVWMLDVCEATACHVLPACCVDTACHVLPVSEACCVDA